MPDLGWELSQAQLTDRRVEGNCQSEVLGPGLDLHVPSVLSASQATHPVCLPGLWGLVYAVFSVL